MEKIIPDNNSLIKRIIQFIIIVLILLFPLMNADEINRGVNIKILNIDIRIVKDLGLIAIIVLSFFMSCVQNRLNKYYKYLPFILGFVVLTLIVSRNVPDIIIMCGLRWFLPILLPIFLYDVIDYDFLKKIYNAFTVIFFIHLGLQIYELFYMPPYEGYTYWGLTGRVPGIMRHASLAGCLVCVYYLLVMRIEPMGNKRLTLTFLIVLSLMLCMSSTGFCTFITIYLIYKTHKILKRNRFLFFFVPFFVFFFFLNADTVINRQEGQSSVSIGIRGDLLSMIVESADFVSDRFGYATNAAIITMTNDTKYHTLLWADSFYTSFIANLGIIATFILLGMMVSVLRWLIHNSFYYALCCFVCYSMMSIAVITVETFPINLMYGVFVAYFLKKYQIIKTHNETY